MVCACVCSLFVTKLFVLALFKHNVEIQRCELPFSLSLCAEGSKGNSKLNNACARKPVEVF